MQPGNQITKRRPCDEQWQTAGIDAMCRDGTASIEDDTLQTEINRVFGKVIELDERIQLVSAAQ